MSMTAAAAAATTAAAAAASITSTTTVATTIAAAAATAAAATTAVSIMFPTPVVAITAVLHMPTACMKTMLLVIKLPPVITAVAIVVAALTPPAVCWCAPVVVMAATVIAPVACIVVAILPETTPSVFIGGGTGRKSRVLVVPIAGNALRWAVAAPAVAELPCQVAHPGPALEVGACLVRHHPRIVLDCI